MDYESHSTDQKLPVQLSAVAAMVPVMEVEAPLWIAAVASGALVNLPSHFYSPLSSQLKQHTH